MLISSLPTLSHPELCLRPIRAADLPIWADYLRQPQVYQHTSWNLQSERELDHNVWDSSTQTPDSPLRLAIARRDTDQLVGTIGLHTVSSQNKSCELAYDLSPSHWGRRIASCAAQTMVQWAHQQADMTRIQATVLLANTPSIAVIERCGFQKEGLLRSFRQVRGLAMDFWLYSHLAADEIK